ncbi:MAG: bifunctional proline dehydrogenase/L-glutamate gamma-semialdehyde dehydrogenase PutA [Proteobacteria bacterium]|nr:bifunctional proline dehydrogenase/L-glutamate gamma-semialdehyde dehydrogenase PutA [Pseudomonadota bacterium]
MIVPDRSPIDSAYRQDETVCIKSLLQCLDFSPEKLRAITDLATELVLAVRKHTYEASGVEALITHYDLSTPEGILLMCIAETLLRIPDAETEELLIRDKLTSARWQEHIGKSQSTFVNITTWGLALSGKILDGKQYATQFQKIWHGLLQKWGEPVIRKAVHQAVKIMGNQFVVGRKMDDALKASQENIQKGYLYSYDMLGEVARTQADADRYFQAYDQAIAQLHQIIPLPNQVSITRRPGISVKLSALYPRYQFSHRQQAVAFLTEKLYRLALRAKEWHIGLTVDAEEADRLDMSLEIFTAVLIRPELKDWNGLGLAVQAYQKRALPVIQWLIELVRRQKKHISVRLVKGAYWDAEIKLTQIGGFKDYPVFTRKNNTDVCYLACAKTMLQAQDTLYPQFATHNAYSVAAILNMMKPGTHYDFEFQSLQGMGRALHDILVERGYLCRIYGPVGSHEDLLPYLVRRLLENGANSSFVNQIANPKTPLENLITSPLEKLTKYPSIPNPKIPLPKDIYGSERLNSSGVDLSDSQVWRSLEMELAPFIERVWQAAPFCGPLRENHQIITNPADRSQIVGQVSSANEQDIARALNQAVTFFDNWNRKPVQERANCLLRAAELLEANRAELLCLMSREAGKNLFSGISEIREAVDFCRYYSQVALKIQFPASLPGPTGETNTLMLSGRGPILCISPWNFPVAIFTGQIAAALVTGNTVIAKPAEQTPLTAARIVQLFHQAGTPAEVLQLLPGSGEVVGAGLVKDTRIQGVIFTGSTETAKAIYQTLANRPGPIVPLIAETGGVNAMIADSSALPEQLVNDVVISAFDSAGQRCSALRVLFVQEDIADKVITMLRGAMAELTVGDPLHLATDIGPVIDADASSMLAAHSEKMSRTAQLIYQVPLSAWHQRGTFFAPQAFEIADLTLVKKEVFGPILHVIRYSKNDLPKIVADINALGYGLTFGIQSRIDSTIDYLQSHVQAGNIYVNRNMIGAVVGVQPFGGRGLSGTGPKAGGPHYLVRLCNETTLTINTTAMGGNAVLMTLED